MPIEKKCQQKERQDRDTVSADAMVGLGQREVERFISICKTIIYGVIIIREDLVQPEKGRQEAAEFQGIRSDAIGEQLDNAGDCVAAGHKQEVDGNVENRCRDDIAGDHDGEDSQSEGEDHHARGQDQPVEQIFQLRHSLKEADEDAGKERNHLGDRKEQDAGEHMRDEEGFPAHRKGMDHIGAPGLIQVGEYGNSGDTGKQEDSQWRKSR